MSIDVLISECMNIFSRLGGTQSLLLVGASVAGVVVLRWIARRMRIWKAREAVRRDPEVQRLARQWDRRRTAARSTR